MENAADIVFAMYCKIKSNHIYAAPNKYYEAMLLGKPLITTKGTLPGKKVESNGTGWAVEEDVEALKSLLGGLKKDEIKEKGKKALRLWKEKYQQELYYFFENSYSKIIK